MLHDVNHVGIASEIDAQLQNVDQTLEALRDKSRFISEENRHRRKSRRGGSNETIKLRAKVNETLANQIAFFTESTTSFPCLSSRNAADLGENFPEHSRQNCIFSPR